MAASNETNEWEPHNLGTSDTPVCKGPSEHGSCSCSNSAAAPELGPPLSRTLRLHERRRWPWDLTFSSPQLERLFVEYFARRTYSWSLAAHLTYLTAIMLSFTVRCILEPPPLALQTGWTCKEQQARGLLLEGFACEGGQGRQVGRAASREADCLRRAEHLPSWHCLAGDLPWTRPGLGDSPKYS